MEITKERIAKLSELLNKPEVRSRRSHVLSSHYDPDSIACILMMKFILEYFQYRVDIYLPGKPEDNFQQNATIVSKFGLSNHILQINDDFLKRIQPEDLIVFVDTPTFNDVRFTVKVPKPHILIDHHSRPDDMIENEGKEWYWYESCGACVSMITHLMIELKVVDDLEENELKRVGTLGVLGILGDSKRLTSRYTTPFDFEMIAYLSKHSDKEKISNVSNNEYDESFLASLGIPRDRWMRVGPTLVFRMESDGSTLKKAELNLLMAADNLLIKFKDVQTVFVWTLVSDRILIKARNSRKDYDLDSEIKKMFGESNGGARENSMGAACVKNELMFFDDYEQSDRPQLIDLCDKRIKRKVFGKL